MLSWISPYTNGQIETPLSAKLTSPLSGENPIIADLMKYFSPLKGEMSALLTEGSR